MCFIKLFRCHLSIKAQNRKNCKGAHGCPQIYISLGQNLSSTKFLGTGIFLYAQFAFQYYTSIHKVLILEKTHHFFYQQKVSPFISSRLLLCSKREKRAFSL